MLDIVQNVVLGGAGLGLLVLVMARLMPKAKIREIGLRHGRWSSKLGRSRLGLPWEKLETFIEDTLRVYMDAFWEGANEDDKAADSKDAEPPSASSTDGVVAGAAIRGALLFAFLLLSSSAQAEILLLQWGRFAVHLPLARVDTTYLYDFEAEDADKNSRWGGETPLFDVPVPFSKKKASVVLGATTDTIRKGEPFLGLNHDLGRIASERVSVGLFAGKKTGSSDFMWGLKASYPLWGAKE